MSRARVYVGILGFGACVAMLLIGMYLATHERVTETEPVGPSGRAVRDDFWAANLLLQEMGVQTESRYGLGQLPPPGADTVIVVLASDYEHRLAMSKRLFDWVLEGGHLVFAAQPSNEADHFPSFNGESWDPGTPPDAALCRPSRELWSSI